MKNFWGNFIGLYLFTFAVTSAFADARVVTSLPVEATITREIAGDTATVNSIIQIGADPHEFEPRPSDVIKLQHCDLFIHGGLDLAPWKDSLIKATGRADLISDLTATAVPGTAKKVLDLSKSVSVIGIPTIALPTGQHAFGNPHYWLAPENGRAMARSIAAQLTSNFPEHANMFSKNLAQFEKEIDAVESDIAMQAKKYSGIKLIAQHDEWSYLTNTLGFEIPAYIEAQPGKQPAPSQIKKIKELLAAKALSIMVLDTDNGDYRLAISLADDAYLPVVRLSQQPENGETYAHFLGRDVMLLTQTLSK